MRRRPMVVWSVPLLILALAGGASGGGAGTGILPGISISRAGDDGQRAEQMCCCIGHGLGAGRRPLKPLRLRGGFGIRDHGVEIFDPNESDSVSTLQKRGEGWNLIEEDFYPRDESAAERDGYEYVTDTSEELAKTLERRPGNSTAELDGGAKRARHASPQPDDDEQMLEDIGMRNSTTTNQAESGSDSDSDDDSDDDDDEPVEQTPDMVAGEALREACFAGNKSEVARLIDVVSNVDLRSGSGVSAFTAAIAGGHLDIASHLLDRGANLNARDDWNQSALHIAASFGKVSSARFLLEKGIDPDLMTVFGQTARDTAIGGQKMYASRHHPTADHDPVRASGCEEVAHLLQKIGARCWDPNEDEVERMMRIAANWDPETVGRAELIEMDKHKGEGSDSPEELRKEWNRSVHLLEGLDQAKEMEEQNPDFDTDGAELKRPIHGPEGLAWRDPWGRDMDFYINAQMERREAEGRGEHLFPDGQESTPDLEEFNRPPLDGFEAETKAEAQHRLIWSKHAHDNGRIAERLENGETEEEIVMWDLEKGCPDPGLPSLMDQKPHYLQEKFYKEGMDEDIMEFMKPVIEKESTPPNIDPVEWTKHVNAGANNI